MMKREACVHGLVQGNQPLLTTDPGGHAQAERVRIQAQGQQSLLTQGLEVSPGGLAGGGAPSRTGMLLLSRRSVV